MQGYRKLNNAWHWAFIVYYITTCVASDIHTRTVWIQDHGYTLLYVFFFIFIVENYSYARNSRTSVKIYGNFVQICPDEFLDKSTRHIPRIDILILVAMLYQVAN